jgi:hypothetical protein
MTGFVNPSTKDFRLTSSSSAVNAGSAVPILFDDLGNVFPVDTDFDVLTRTVGSAIDAGAYEYR